MPLDVSVTVDEPVGRAVHLADSDAEPADVSHARPE